MKGLFLSLVHGTCMTTFLTLGKSKVVSNIPLNLSINALQPQYAKVARILQEFLPGVSSTPTSCCPSSTRISSV